MNYIIEIFNTIVNVLSYTCKSSFNLHTWPSHDMSPAKDWNVSSEKFIFV